jgi:hypothetical protein
VKIEFAGDLIRIDELLSYDFMVALESEVKVG